MMHITEEQQVRIWIRRILNEQKAASSGGGFEGWVGSTSQGEMGKAFIDPFKNVFAAAQLTFKDILTTAKFGWDILVTIDPKKLQATRKNYKDRMAKSKEKHKALRKKIGEAAGPDFNLGMFMFNPAGSLAAAPFSAAWKSQDDIKDFFREAGFGGPSKEEKEGGTEKPKGILGTAFDALRNLFFMGPTERYMPDGVLLLEQEKKKKGVGGKNLQAEMLAVMKEMGILEPMMESAEDMVAALKESLEELDDLFGPSYKTISEIFNSETLEDFQQALENAKQLGLDVGGPSASKLTTDLESSAKEFLNDPKQKETLVRALAEEQGKKIGKGEDLPEVNDEELKKMAAEKIFQNSSEELRETMTDSIDELKKQVGPEIEAIEEEFGLTAESQKMMEQTDVGKEMMKVLNDFKEAYGLVKS